MTAEQLMAEVNNLKKVAERHEAEQARARAQEEKAKLELEDLTTKLQTLFGAEVDWAAAEQLLPQAQAEALAAVEKVRAQLTEAGLV